MGFVTLRWKRKKQPWVDELNHQLPMLLGILCRHLRGGEVAGYATVLELGNRRIRRKHATDRLVLAAHLGAAGVILFAAI